MRTLVDLAEAIDQVDGQLGVIPFYGVAIAVRRERVEDQRPHRVRN